MSENSNLCSYTGKGGEAVVTHRALACLGGSAHHRLLQPTVLLLCPTQLPLFSLSCLQQTCKLPGAHIHTLTCLLEVLVKLLHFHLYKHSLQAMHVQCATCIQKQGTNPAKTMGQRTFRVSVQEPVFINAPLAGQTSSGHS